MLLNHRHHIEEISVHPIPHLSDYLEDLETVENKFFRTRTGQSNRAGYQVRVGEDQVILADLVRKPSNSDGTGFVRAGPRDQIYFRPEEVCAAIVTCGGLCPGMNDVICELVRMLHCMFILHHTFHYCAYLDDLYLLT